MTNIHILPDQRIPKAMDEIIDILHSFDPPIHGSTALGILELCKLQLMSEHIDGEHHG